MSDRLSEAIARGAVIRKKLIATEGGWVSIDEAAAKLSSSAGGLKFSADDVAQMYREGSLLAVENGTKFPVWQFDLPHIDEVLGHFKRKYPDVDDYGKLLFFLANSRALGGKRPLDLLRADELKKVLQSVDSYCNPF